uniref:Uncharacterized protein LOC104249225 n=1 Tax=Nicotiana sylvestris TaxID=4096 RepID=A0A1U7YIH6_NICSY|nr:PREDICTED: uncharacterized protein LOC104249225 [Nicotiana sylvestris]
MVEMGKNSRRDAYIVSAQGFHTSGSFLASADCTCGDISWKSSKQTYIARSTMESEYIALELAGQEAEWLRNLLADVPLWGRQASPVSLHCDSQAAIGIAKNNMYNGERRHICIRHGALCANSKFSAMFGGAVESWGAADLNDLHPIGTKSLSRDDNKIPLGFYKTFEIRVSAINSNFPQ